MFWCYHHQGAYNLSLLKLRLLKQSIYTGVVNPVVWLHMLLGPCWCMSTALFGTRLVLRTAFLNP